MKFDARKGDSGWLYDNDGLLCRPDPISGDTETGECLCIVYDKDGRIVIDEDKGEVVTMVRHFKPPLVLIPIPEGGGKPPYHQPGLPLSHFVRRGMTKPDIITEKS